MNKSIKKAFTLAETIMTLFIVGLVVTSAIPVFTQKRATEAPAVDIPWQTCDAAKGGLCTTEPIAIGDEALNWYNLSVNSDKDIFDVFKGDKRAFGLAGDVVQYDGTNLFITPGATTARDSYSNVTNNVVLDSTAPSSAFNNNVIIGANTLNTNAAFNVIVGTGNTLGSGVANATVVGSGNTPKANSVIIGNGIKIEKTDFMICNTGTGTGTDCAKEHTADPFINIGDHIYGTLNALTLNATDVHVSGTFVGVMNIASDERLKNVKSFYQKGLNEILQVNPVVFTYKNDVNQNQQVGVIAQDLQKIFPEAVVKMPSGYLGIDTAPVFFAMMNAMKEVNSMTELEQERQKTLEAELEVLAAELKELSVCKSDGFVGRINCFLVDLKRFLKSFYVFAKVEVNDEEA